MPVDSRRRLMAIRPGMLLVVAALVLLPAGFRGVPAIRRVDRQPDGPAEVGAHADPLLRHRTPARKGSAPRICVTPSAGRSRRGRASGPPRVGTTFVGFTSAQPGDEDGASTLGFANRPDLDRVLGSTNFLIDTVTGEIVESDIFFNSAFPWSVSAGGETGRLRFESIALHEIGHFFGLGHSALGETEVVGTGRRRAGRRGGDVPDCLLRRATSATARCAPTTSRASRISIRPRLSPERGSIGGRVTEEWPGRVRRARCRVQPGDAQARRRTSPSTTRAGSRSPGSTRASTSCASSRWTMRTWTASLTRRAASTSTSRSRTCSARGGSALAAPRGRWRSQ